MNLSDTRDDRLLLLIWLSVKTNFSSGVKKHLSRFSPEELYMMNKSELLEAGFTEPQAERLSEKRLDGARLVLTRCERQGVDVVAFDDSRYPKKLLQFSDSPLILYCAGNTSLFNEGFKVGFVGTRSTTIEGESFSKKEALALIEHGALLVSGGALGIDTVAIDASHEKKSPCVIVLGCDINQVYPAKNYSRFSYVSKTGLLVSEYPPGTGARYFVARNRIIAGLSDRLVVPEAPLKSGALTTASHASRYGVPIFARAAAGESFEGCRSLIERGARAYISADDTVSFSFPTPLKKESAKVERPVVIEIKNEKNLLEKYSSGTPFHVVSCILEGRDTPDKMADKNHRINDILCTLTELELEGDVTALPGNRYKLN